MGIDTTRRIVLIAALDEQRHIGKNNRLLWHLPADLRRFRRLTMGQAVLMGRKTYESIGKPLPGRTNWVLTRQRFFHCDPQVHIVHSLEEAMARTRTLWIIGGGGVYAEALPFATHMELTHVEHTFDGDVTFPAWDDGMWQQTEETIGEINLRHPFRFRFCSYERR